MIITGNEHKFYYHCRIFKLKNRTRPKNSEIHVDEDSIKNEKQAEEEEEEEEQPVPLLVTIHKR